MMIYIKNETYEKNCRTIKINKNEYLTNFDPNFDSQILYYAVESHHLIILFLKTCDSITIFLK